MTEGAPSGERSSSLRRILVPLALAQFICSFAGSNMNVMINDISKDLNTTVHGVQTAITLFLLVMAALMIPGGKLTDRWGRKRCFTIGLIVYGVGALISAVSPGLGSADCRKLDLRGRRDRTVDPSRLHPDDDAVQRHDIACTSLRCDHWDGRRRRRRRTIDRGPDHHGHKLAGGLCLPGHRCRSDRPFEPLGRRSGPSRPDPSFRHARRSPVRCRSGPYRHGCALGRQQSGAHRGAVGRRARSYSSCFSSIFVRGSTMVRSRCFRPSSSATAHRTWG